MGSAIFCVEKAAIRRKNNKIRENQSNQSNPCIPHIICDNLHCTPLHVFKIISGNQSALIPLLCLK